MPDIPDVIVQQAQESDLDAITELIRYTVEQCYPAIYPDKVVRFYYDYHSPLEVHRRWHQGYMASLKRGERILGTGFVIGSELGGVYIHPNFQRQGLAKILVQHLLAEAKRQKLERLWLDATPIAKSLYEQMGFQLISPMVQMVDDQELPYFKMEMVLKECKI